MTLAAETLPNEPQNSVQPLLSVIIPVYNGASKIQNTVANIQARIELLHDSMWAAELQRSKNEYSLLTTGDYPVANESTTAELSPTSHIVMDTSGATLSTKNAMPSGSKPFPNWYEIIVVNDGSKDKTLNAIKKVCSADKRIRCISYGTNRGKGHAIKKGVLSSMGKYILFMDGDGDISADVLTRYIQRLSKADIVIGSKNHRQSVVKAPFSRRFFSRCFQVYAKVLLGLKVGDTQVGLKAGRGEVFRGIFEQVQVERYAFDAEMLAIAGLMDVKVVELPVKINLEKSFKKKEIFRMAIDVLRVAFRLRVKKSYREIIDERPRQSVPTVAEA